MVCAMNVSRRELIVLAAVAGLGGCAAHPDEGSESGASFVRGPVDAGSIADYSHDGIYGRYRDSAGFFVIRQSGRLYAQSAVCTHRACRIKPKGNDGFVCPCHGSTFTREGEVTQGPARRNLPRFAIQQSPEGRLVVHTDRPLTPEELDAPIGRILLG